MEYAKIGMLTLNTFDKNNNKAVRFVWSLCEDNSIQSRFQGILSGLTNPKNEFFNHGFLVTLNNNFIGYINISDYNNVDRCIYLKAAIAKEQRGKSYGKILLSEITEYIFEKYPEVEIIYLKIDKDNKPSLMTANACGYKWLTADFYTKDNPYLDKEPNKKY